MFIEKWKLTKTLKKLQYNEEQVKTIINAYETFGNMIIAYFTEELLTTSQIEEVINFFARGDKFQQQILLQMPSYKRIMVVSFYNKLMDLNGVKTLKDLDEFYVGVLRKISDAAQVHNIGYLSKVIEDILENPRDYDYNALITKVFVDDNPDKILYEDNKGTSK